MAAASPDEVLAMIAFARVVEAKSFTAAARKLGVAKSVVSARITALERELKARLLHRTTRKLSLTPEGAALYERCARVAAAADDTAAAFAGAGDAPRGLLRVNAPIVFAEDYLAQPIAAYLARHPDVRIELGVADRVIDLVEEGVDVAIRITTQLVGPGLVARKLASDQPVICAAPSYLARRGTPRALADLPSHDCLVYSLRRIADEWSFRDWGASGKPGSKSGGKPPGKRRATGGPITVPIDPRFSAASGAVLRRAAVAGLGVAVLPSFMVAADVAAGRLRVLLEDVEGPGLGIYAVYAEAPDRRTPSKIRAFVDLLATHFKHPPWQV